MERNDIPKNFDEFVECVGLWEGFRSSPYTCPGGVLTIGYGRTENVEENDRTTVANEKIWLSNELLGISALVDDRIAGLSFYENIALTDFCYNCGESNFKKLVNNRSINVIKEKILLYNKANGKVINGLTARRQWELKLMDVKQPYLWNKYRGAIIFKLSFTDVKKSMWCKYTGIHHKHAKCEITGVIDDCAELETPEGGIICVSEKHLMACQLDFMGVV